eukprot:NODE_9440_length_642_cov_73.917148_g9174_i0.p1 GENE.NODE_9440_length_642_cov_73.917148_g9174_i0~~NODE_9440_length_642_cov_73.917148_g9174_i0.p1  ORF type:complete len:173 (+),score=52.11 NODE_9440_length_642_cov_73.917148_g9174_i0:61-519(+)
MSYNRRDENIDNGLTTEQKTLVTNFCEKVGPYIQEQYYKMFDSNRAAVLELYDEQTPIIWNGYKMVGKAGIQGALQQLPDTTHQVQIIDCQPLPAPDEQVLVLVTVNGIVTYGYELPNRFNQVFILRTEGKQMKIVYDCFRWLAAVNELERE